jgi:hypothetical protein
VKQIVLLFSLLMLTACFEKVEVSQPLGQIPCFEILQESTSMRPIMYNKCTGDSWMLVHTNIIDEEGKKTGGFTYVWHRINGSDQEAILSYGK